MGKRTILMGSLLVNVLLLAIVLWQTLKTGGPGQASGNQATRQTTETHTNVVVRRQFFTWAELESEDYSTFIENLRRIDCPEETIRDIIIADVDNLFARRRSAETLPTSQQWWQIAPDPALINAAFRQQEALELQRSRLLTDLLGPDWDRPATPLPIVAIKVPLDGPLLGTLSEETQNAVQLISGRAQQAFEQILANSGGGPANPAALAGLETRLRTELRPLLSPAQLEEFLFRYAPSAHRLREEVVSVEFFNPTPLELKSVFLNAGSIELQLMGLSPDNAGSDSQRQALMRSREIAIQNALGPERFRQYERLQDPAYRSAVAASRAAGATNMAEIFYAIEQAGAEEAAQIRNNTNLTPLEQEAALQRLGLQQLEAAAEVLGEPIPDETAPSEPPVRTYSARQGDTLAGISMQTGVPVALILRANPTLEAGNIAPGTKIIIPDRTAPFP